MGLKQKHHVSDLYGSLITILHPVLYCMVEKPKSILNFLQITILQVFWHLWYLMFSDLQARASGTGSWINQFAALLTANAMSELSQSHDSETELFQTTHVGCNPVDGFVAWRQTCRKEADSDTFSFVVKVRISGLC